MIAYEDTKHRYLAIWVEPRDVGAYLGRVDATTHRYRLVSGRTVRITEYVIRFVMNRARDLGAQ